MNKLSNSQNESSDMRHSYIISLISLICMVSAAWYAISSTIINSDMQQFLPQYSSKNTSENIHPVKVMSVLSESSSGLFLISIQGGTEEQRATTSIDLRTELIKNNFFISVNNGQGKLSKKDKAVLKKYRYLLSSQHDVPNSNVMSENFLSSQFEKRYQEIISPLSGLFKKTIQYDPTAEIRYFLSQLRGDTQPNKKHSVWFSQNFNAALLVVLSEVNGSDINEQQKAITLIKKSFKNNNSNNLKLSMTGAGVFAVDARTKIKAESQTISIVASIAVMLLIFIAFRSVWYVMIAVVPLLSAILIAVIVTQSIFNSIQGITLAFGLTLIGVALDYPVHIFSHAEKNKSLAQSLNDIWPTIRLGALTTSLGFLALTQTSFSGLAQLGVFSMSGIITAALVSRYAMPSLMMLRPISVINKVPKWVVKLSQIGELYSAKRVSAISLLAISLLFIFPVNWENNLIKLSPISYDQLELDNELRQQLKADNRRHVAVIKAKDRNAILLKAESIAPQLERMVQDKIINGYRSPHQVLPSYELQIKRQQNLPEKKVLQKRVEQSLKNHSLSEKIFRSFIKDVESSKTLTPLNRDTLQATQFSQQLSTLLYPYDNEWIGVIRFIGVNNATALQSAIDSMGNNELQYINIKTTSQSIVNDFKNEALELIGIGLIVIFVVLAVSIGIRERLFRVCFIVGTALVLDIVLLNMFGQALSLFHLISLLLVIGLGLDYSLFFTRPNTNNRARERIVYGLLVCFGSTALVFGMLALSNIPVLAAIGTTVIIGVSICFILAVLFSEQSKERVVVQKIVNK